MKKNIILILSVIALIPIISACSNEANDAENSHTEVEVYEVDEISFKDERDFFYQGVKLLAESENDFMSFSTYLGNLRFAEGDNNKFRLTYNETGGKPHSLIMENLGVHIVVVEIGKRADIKELKKQYFSAFGKNIKIEKMDDIMKDIEKESAS